MHRLYKRLPEACFRKGFWQAVYAAQLRLGKSEIYEVHLRSPPTPLYSSAASDVYKRQSKYPEEKKENSIP